jgi:hypothetical protein
VVEQTAQKRLVKYSASTIRCAACAGTAAIDASPTTITAVTAARLTLACFSLRFMNHVSVWLPVFVSDVEIQTGPIANHAIDAGAPAPRIAPGAKKVHEIIMERR